MNPLSAMGRYVRGSQSSRRNHTNPLKNRRPRLVLEVLEDRTVPSALSVADVTVREGPTSTGILDPAGAAAVGLNGTRGITFDTRPTDAHYGDLFVTGYLSHSVARFDWASQTYQPFVASGSGGLNYADQMPWAQTATSTSATIRRIPFSATTDRRAPPCPHPARRARSSSTRVPPRQVAQTISPLAQTATSTWATRRTRSSSIKGRQVRLPVRTLGCSSPSPMMPPTPSLGLTTWRSGRMAICM